MLKMRSFTVTEVTKYIKKILTIDPILSHLIVEGEISNFTKHSSGHAYFTLKDEKSKLNCVMFAQAFETINFLPKNGDKVHAKGNISIYERDGKYQFYVAELENIGLGALHIEFNRLKEKLNKEGYFDDRHKKKMPLLPNKIGVITSPTGAAIRDIISVVKRRSGLADIIIYPVRVQGEFAKDEICEGIDFFNRQTDIDVIILSRGGGSIEELWAFNEIEVAMGIFYSDLPIITGIGHETDFTISDFIADMRAPTPSAAAEIAVKSKQEIKLELSREIGKINQSIQNKMSFYQMRLDRVTPEKFSKNVTMRLENEREKLSGFQKYMRQNMNDNLNIFQMMLTSKIEKLEALSPMRVLGRGYALAFKQNKPITSIGDVKENDLISIMLRDGYIKAEVTDTEKSIRSGVDGKEKGI